jgi:hypothetical protein
MVRQFAKTDFQRFVKGLEAKGGINDDNRSSLRSFRKIHDITYVIAIWEEKLTTFFQEENQYFFVSDLKSDLVQLMTIVLVGHKKSTALLLRSAIENTLKHLFFYHHPIEFIQYRAGNYPCKLEDLSRYARDHPFIGQKVSESKVIDQLVSRYKELSKRVHGRNTPHQELAENLESIRFDPIFFEEILHGVNELGNAVGFIFYLFHVDLRRQFRADEREYVLDCIHDDTYQILRSK